MGRRKSWMHTEMNELIMASERLCTLTAIAMLETYHFHTFFDGPSGIFI